ncbi:hypothetical protein [Saccharomonospora iraqiensis]|uniref:hypothetical protein n=1 Tax=Saccharomonospora iraqiensis TaxID=52698 RepID=UPI00022DECDE|nr:hypothetical protein [Saccharomonospora iraqiensis]
MALTACADPSPARWLGADGSPWTRLVTFGPSGFAAHARLRFLPDPAHPGQAEADADGDDHAAVQLRTLFDVLAEHTRTPRECYFGLWDGSGTLVGVELPAVADEPAPPVRPDPDAVPGVAPADTLPPPLPGPRVELPHRSYVLFRGPLSDAGDWTTPDGWPAQPRLDITDTALAWPADRAWFVANDVDPHWAGIGADPGVIDRLVADPRLDAVPADPDAEQPRYS